MEFEMTGIDELISTLEKKDEDVSRGINKVLKESAVPLKQGIEANTPLGPGNHGSHAVHEVRIGRISNDGFERRVPVGYTSESAWYMWFLEKGTYSKGNPKGIKPQDNVANAMFSTKGEVAKIQIDGLTELVGGS